MIKNKLKKAFTLTELIMVIAIIWILMMWMTVYIWWSGEKTKIIEAEWCANSLWWVMDNYLYYALTSRTLSGENDTIYSYYIQLSWWTLTSNKNCITSEFTWSNPIFCNEIVLGYHTWNSDLTIGDSPAVYQERTIWDVCRQNKSNLWFYRSWLEGNVSYLKMNKWFAQTNIADRNVFYIVDDNTDNNERERSLLWEIIIVMCSDDNCTWRKQIAKWVVDSRSQTISLIKCKYYDENDLRMCKIWEDCKQYDPDNPTVCLD
jgi:prepilin-type N-terminal cleavage/methylation domain-containing protein